MTFINSAANRRASALIAALLATCNAEALAFDDEVDEIFVWGRATNLLGVAQSASEGIVGYADFETRPMSRVGELVEVIPGVVATQHSGSGKANQYFMRGFNLDHGTDFAVSLDGQPINYRTHGHGQGYLDLNFIIPEIVERVEFRKGPYHANSGDFSLAASADFVTYDRLDENFAEVTIGENNFYRLVSAGSVEVAGGDLLLAVEGQLYEGPWVLDEDVEKLNIFSKFSRDFGGVRAEIAASFYDSSWTSTDQVPLRAIENSIIDRLGFIDPDLGGETTRGGVTGELSFDSLGGVTVAKAYVTNYDFNLFSNFTYFAGDPVNGDEFEQRDRRWIYGGDVEHTRHFHINETRLNLRFGGEVRFDDIRDVGLFQTIARQRFNTVRQDKVEQLSLGGFGEVEFEPIRDVRMTAGLRIDHFDISVDALSLPANSGDATDTIVSPSFGLVWRAAPPLELYANYGRGFHSNDGRGATISFDPVNLDPVDPVDILVAGEGAEIGARFVEGPFNLTLAGFWLDIESELLFVGDAGTTEANGATSRYGIEGSAFWQATDWLVIDASGGYTDASYKEEPAEADRIPGAVGVVFAAGAVATRSDFTGSVRLRHFGSAPLIEDGAVSSEPTTLVNLGLDYDIGRITLGLDVFNLLDSKDADITYFFESQLPGETTPVEDIHFHPVEPRQIRASIRAHF